MSTITILVYLVLALGIVTVLHGVVASLSRRHDRRDVQAILSRIEAGNNNLIDLEGVVRGFWDTLEDIDESHQATLREVLGSQKRLVEQNAALLQVLRKLLEPQDD